MPFAWALPALGGPAESDSVGQVRHCRVPGRPRVRLRGDRAAAGQAHGFIACS
jgi:hypothetical protein